MSSYNKIIMLGNLTRDPETKTLSNGHVVCNFAIASSKKHKNKSGEMTEETCFIDVNVWGIQAENCQKYLTKGKQVLVDGRLKQENWQDKDGNKRSKHSLNAESIVFMGSKDNEAQKSGSAVFMGDDIAAELHKVKSPFIQKKEPLFNDELPF